MYYGCGDLRIVAGFCFFINYVILFAVLFSYV